METKEEIYTALGFPVVLVNPVYVDFGDEKVLDISPEEIEDAIFNALITKPTRLTGAEIQFIRSYMELTQAAFGESVFVDASTVTKWEGLGQEFTQMPKPTEALIRMRCKLFVNGRDRIAGSFLDNLALFFKEEMHEYTHKIEVWGGSNE